LSSLRSDLFPDPPPSDSPFGDGDSVHIEIERRRAGSDGGPSPRHRNEKRGECANMLELLRLKADVEIPERPDPEASRRPCVRSAGPGRPRLWKLSVGGGARRYEFVPPDLRDTLELYRFAGALSGVLGSSSESPSVLFFRASASLGRRAVRIRTSNHHPAVRVFPPSRRAMVSFLLVFGQVRGSRIRMHLRQAHITIHHVFVSHDVGHKGR